MAANPSIRVLNEKQTPSNKPAPAPDISAKLRKSLLKLKGKYMSTDGKGVDYKSLKKSNEFAEYEKETGELKSVELEKLTELQRKVFFINVYNALTIHGLVEQPELPDSVLKVQHFFKTIAYDIGGFTFTLDDIEHGILRGNKSHPASIKPLLDANDPRLKFAMQSCDPRLHFALVCGAKGCPAISVYTEDNLDKALNDATRAFCQSEVSMHTEVDEIRMSRIFQWYRQDFGETDTDVIRWVMQYLSQDQQDRASILLLKLEKFGQVSINYNEYDWSLNTS
ncbi:hypothetical protein BaRGS_00031584 [Batillaria attramentaria]|uniref:DUF547 domain-containing protein n=1 Tax=Batillaria attramentaria TaxID=370345 RepID=A0ABD0JQF1_9CAEN|nr:hypothetical protein BaRGS_033216 [Batillaria attramentaria]